MIRCMQINVDGRRNAQELMMATANQQALDVLIISEPYRCGIESEGWYSDAGDKAAVMVFNPNMQVQEIGPRDNPGFRWVTVGGTTIYACYWSPNTEYTLFVDFLDRLEGSIRTGKGMVLVAGDFNAKSPAWGDHTEDPKGRVLMDMMASLGMVVCNSGDRPTFSRAFAGGISRSHIDITFVSGSASHTVRDWKVAEEYTGSLHNYIFFNVSRALRTGSTPAEERWAWRKLDMTKLSNFIRQTRFAPEVEALSSTDALNRYLQDACNSCMPKGTYRGGKKPTYWWTQEIATLRGECHKARREFKRGRLRPAEEQEQRKQAFKRARKELKLAIKKACWNDLCRQVETDPWGLPYKIVTKKLVGRRPIPGLTIPGRVETIIDTLFPRENVAVWPRKTENLAFPEVTSSEVSELAHRIPRGKAPGPDGVPDLVVKEIATHRPEILRDVYNICLREGVFPYPWKVAKLVLLRKGDKPLDDPSSYRPICLLNTVGKFFERIIKARIEKRLEENDNLNDRQYGFRKGKSTVDAIKRVMSVVDAAGSGPLYRRKLCAVVALDVANAFNSAKWPKIVKALEDKGFPRYLVRILQSYLSDRTIVYEGTSRPCTCGVPQGSVLGPLLWNLMYDGLLQVDMEGNERGMSSTELVAFADDVAVVATGHTPWLLETATNRALNQVAEWMTSAGLTLSVRKTEAVILTTKRGYSLPEFSIMGDRIEIKDCIRYLGVELHRVLGFKAHAEKAAAKAQIAASALARLMPNVGGSGQRKRKLLSTVVTSKLLYASPIWSEALVFNRNVEILERPQRTIAIRIACAYRTVSTAAVMVIAGLIPAHLLAWERTEKYKRRHEPVHVSAEIRRNVMHKWQTEWENGSTGRWTRRLIKDVNVWMSRKHGIVDFHLTQFLSNHGCFGQYLHRFGKLETAICVDCQDPVDDAEHVFFVCDRWWRERRSLEVLLEEDFNPEGVIECMLKKRCNWEAVSNFVKHVQSTREQEERVRQNQ